MGDDHKWWQVKEVVAYEATLLNYSFQRATMTELKEVIDEVDALHLNPNTWPDEMKEAFRTAEPTRERRRPRIKKCKEHGDLLRFYCPTCVRSKFNTSLEYLDGSIDRFVRMLADRLKKESIEFRVFKYKVDSTSKVPIIKAEDARKLVWEVYGELKQSPVIPPTPKNDKNKPQQD